MAGRAQAPLDRRRFLGQVAGVGATSLAGNLLPGLQAAAPLVRPRAPGKSIIVLWMGGGLPHIDLWSVGRHVGHANQGPFQPIKTAAKGIEISETMPKVAEQFAHLSVIRTLNSREGDPARATVRMLTGLPPSPFGPSPHIGSVVARHAGRGDLLISSVAVGGAALGIGPGFLGHAYAPVPVSNPGQAPENLHAPAFGDPAVTASRLSRRKDLLNVLEENFRSELAAEGQATGSADLARSHADLVNKALDITVGARKGMFVFDAPDNKLLDQFGNNGFGRGCLLACKLVEAGVSAVQVDLGGWDMHGNIAEGVRRLATGVLDPAFAALVRTLAERDLLRRTLVVCLAPFGRMPRVIPGGHAAWTRGWDIVLGGAGIRPGVEYGTMEVGGMEIEKNPVSVNQLFATLYAALGIDVADRDFQGRYLGASIHQGAKLVDRQIMPIKELLAG